MITELKTPAPEEPDDEEAQVLLQELGAALRERYALEAVERNNNTVIPGFEPAKVGERLYGPENGIRNKKDSGAPFGEVLEKRLAAAIVRGIEAKAALDDWHTRDDAHREWKAAQMPAAPAAAPADEAAA